MGILDILKAIEGDKSSDTEYDKYRDAERRKLDRIRQNAELPADVEGYDPYSRLNPLPTQLSEEDLQVVSKPYLSSTEGVRGYTFPVADMMMRSDLGNISGIPEQEAYNQSMAVLRMVNELGDSDNPEAQALFNRLFNAPESDAGYVSFVEGTLPDTEKTDVKAHELSHKFVAQRPDVATIVDRVSDSSNYDAEEGLMRYLDSLYAQSDLAKSQAKRHLKEQGTEGLMESLLNKVLDRM
jgi:hypothetical protein